MDTIHKYSGCMWPPNTVSYYIMFARISIYIFMREREREGGIYYGVHNMCGTREWKLYSSGDGRDCKICLFGKRGRLSLVKYTYYGASRLASFTLHARSVTNQYIDLSKCWGIKGKGDREEGAYMLSHGSSHGCMVLSCRCVHWWP